MALVQAWALERFTSIARRVHKSRQIAPTHSPIPRMTSWTEWYHAKTRYILVGGIASCLTMGLHSCGVRTRRIVSITVQGLFSPIASSHLSSA
ncbi:hypothetical protein LINPERHAP2_LOCUS12615, partial [Linum perenne]